MANPTEHRALERLERLEGRRPDPSTRAAMGYQPSLDGVRALSVIAVILYHGGFHWISGGFFGVEVFFVVSGFLITSLLIEERDRARKVDLWQFWVRRWRRWGRSWLHTPQDESTAEDGPVDVQRSFP